tara:strand:+ start:345 stop:938 length:594 start_codon:yes stop_codon:yes gene_type:complete
MKKISTIAMLVFGISMISLFASTPLFIPYNQSKVSVVEAQPVYFVEAEPIKVNINLDVKNHNAFLEAMGKRESSNNYRAVNRFGYMGKYQFGKSTLKTLKIKVSKEEFLNNPDLQEEAMHKLLLYNQKKLKKYIEKYDGKIVHGILVTESGLLAAAHLGGPGSVRKWFRTGTVRKDGNGVKITSYMKNFSGYSLENL